jgi:hypothetical protein
METKMGKLNVRVALSAQFSKYNRYSDTGVLFTSSNVSQRWMGVTLSDVIPTLVSIFFYSKSQLFLGSPQLPGEKRRSICGIVIDTDQFKQTKAGGWIAYAWCL